MLLPPVLSKDQLGKLPEIINKNGTWVLSVWSYSNTNSKGNSHSEVDEAVNIFLKRVSDLSQSIHLLKKMPGTAIPLWRSLYETVVVFRVLTQPVILNNNEQLFLESIKRFKDFDRLKLLQDGVRTEELLVLDKMYRDLKPAYRMDLEYDWLNLNFDELALKKLSKRYHPSFRDLVFRTQETNYNLRGLLDYYQKASEILHFNYSSVKAASEITTEDVEKITNVVLKEFYTDYLSLIVKLYDGRVSEQAQGVVDITIETLEFVKKNIWGVFLNRMKPMTEEEKKIILSNLSKVDVDKLSILEFLLENQNKNRVLRHYYKIITRAGIFSTILSLLLYLPVLFVYPLFSWLNPLGMPLNPEMNGWYSIVVMIVAYLIVDVAFRIYFSGLLSRYGKDEIVRELYNVIFDDDKGVKFFHYSSLRMYPKFLKLEVNNLADWIIANNEMEEGWNEKI